MAVVHWDFVITAGQSQMVGHAYPPNAFFGNPPPPATNPLKSTEYINDPTNGVSEGLYTVMDPPLAPTRNPYSHHGSALPAFVNTYARLADKKVCIVRTAVDGTALLAANAGANPHWDMGGTLFPNSVALAQGALDYIANLDAGDGYPDGVVIDNVSIIWSQGGKDAGAGNGITADINGDSDYSEAQWDLLERYRTALTGYVADTSEIKLYIEKMYRLPTFDPDACDKVVAAQMRAITLHPNDLYFGFADEAPYFNVTPDKTLIDDGIHYAQRGLDIMGARYAEKIADVLDFPPAINPPVGFASNIAILLRTAPSVPLLPKTFSAAGTYSWVCPTGVTSVKVECEGGSGAGGSGRQAQNGGGGGGGAYASSTISVTPGNTYTIVVGAGGAPVALANGGAGTASSFGTTTVVAAGGSGGVAGATGVPGAGGAGGTTAASTGTTKTAGTNGSAGNAGGSGGAGAPPLGGAGGAGGNPSHAGTAPGGGGGGGVPANPPGAAGAAGMVRISVP